MVSDFPVELPPVLDGLLQNTSGTLALVMASAAVLTILSVLFAGGAVVLHFATAYRERRRRREESQWKPMLFDVMAGRQPPEVLAQAVRQGQRERFLTFLMPYATTVKGHALERIRAVATPLLAPVRRELQSRRPTLRARAVQRIGLLGGARFADALRDVLDDPSDDVAGRALRRLAMLGDPDDASLLLEHLDRLAHMDRRQITSALVELGEEAAPVFRTALADSGRTAFVRMLCAETLRWLGDVEAVPVAVRILEGSTGENPELVASLLRLLRRLGRPEQARVVRSYCTSNVSFVRIHAARALGQLGREEDASLLARLLRNDDNRWVALTAARSLIELNCTEPLRRLGNSAHARSSLALDLVPSAA